MLAKVCDCCGRPIERADAVSGEFDDFDVFVKDKVVFEFEDVCPKCLSALTESLERAVERLRNPQPLPRQKEPQAAPERPREPEPEPEPKALPSPPLPSGVPDVEPVTRDPRDRERPIVENNVQEGVTKMFRTGRHSRPSSC